MTTVMVPTHWLAWWDGSLCCNECLKIQIVFFCQQKKLSSTLKCISHAESAPYSDCIPYCCRTRVAALHFNENSDREQAISGAGQRQWKRKSPKAKKGHPTVAEEKTKATHGNFASIYLCQAVKCIMRSVYQVTIFGGRLVHGKLCPHVFCSRINFLHCSEITGRQLHVGARHQCFSVKLAAAAGWQYHPVLF